jgi:Glycosyl transferase family 2
LRYAGALLLFLDLRGSRTRSYALVRIDTRTISDIPGEVLTFMNVRNELLRLPQTLDHYRTIGVSRFFVTDNGSTEGTKEFLLTQPDCHVFVTSQLHVADAQQ